MTSPSTEAAVELSDLCQTGPDEVFRTGEQWYGFSTFLADEWAADRAADTVTQ